jgi:L-alanine-DL-glutamate epimerase-like enolase superfamily enzyme
MEVISAEAPAQAARQARWARLAGLRQVKVKVGVGDDVARVTAVRDVLDSDVTIRVDANGAWTRQRRPRSSVRAVRRASVEQPIPRGSVEAGPPGREPPLVADESVVTPDDVDAHRGRGRDAVNVRLEVRRSPDR